MYVLKRNGLTESVRFDKIVNRIENLCEGLDRRFVNTHEVAIKVFGGLFDGVATEQIDTLSAEICATMAVQHPEYSILAARIAISNLHKRTQKSLNSVVRTLYNNVHHKTGEPAKLVSRELMEVVQANAMLLDDAIKHERDFQYDYFGYQTLEKSYLLRVNGKIVERPQHMLMRVAVGIHGNDIPAAIETYNLLSERWFTHATPTLFNAGTTRPQMSSCFLLTMKDDSIDGIYDTLKQCARISQGAGGIGLSISNVRAKGSYIRGTGGQSNGIVPMLRNFDMTARYVDQGGGKRKGSIAVYLEPWHADIFEFLELKKNHGKDELRARDLFYALWIPDLFMKRVENNSSWSLFCPNEAPGLGDCYGKEFESLYEKYERGGMARKTIKAQDLWFEILNSQIETGTPYMLFKDACNNKSNQKNLGTIKSSNLCTEILEFTSPDEVAVCNLASLSLPKFIINGRFDHDKLYQVTKVVTRNLNRVIDRNFYPVEEAKTSNLRHRPIGIGVQGLADAFILLRLPFTSDKAKDLNREIFETIYYAAMEASMELSIEEGPYESIEGSPISKGIFQFDMWGVTPSPRWDWEILRSLVVKYGVRNSLLIAPMPTASTSQILGNNECFEPYTSNMGVRRTSAGEFIVVNRHLLKDLVEKGLWNNNVRESLKAYNGSIQKIAEIPDSMKAIYKTVWEISQKDIVDMAADRGAFICQSQSLNIHMTNVNTAKLTSLHFHAWKKGLKTGMYYLRTEAATDAIKFTVDKSLVKTGNIPAGQREVVESKPIPENLHIPNQLSLEEMRAGITCSLDNPEGCEMCSG